MRRKLVAKQREKYKDIWPVLNSSAKHPAGWEEWPAGNNFAFILTHDVELRAGHDKCLELLETERELGFVSSFNFVPERYKVDKHLREKIEEAGFEIGVHGLNHDGKLFSNYKIFSERAEKINKYLQEWNSVGFRAPAMHHNLEWLTQLNIEYDLSTFDTDPFEPQSDGAGTIFPFWYESKKNGKGYIEMPYTLVQDFTLLVLMNEKSCDIWKRKLDFIAQNGGMALLNVHPDYIDFTNSGGSFQQFPLNIYKDFLNYVKTEYEGKYWNVIPKEAAKHIKKMLVKS